jgi:hypothetical protein
VREFTSGAVRLCPGLPPVSLFAVAEETDTGVDSDGAQSYTLQDMEGRMDKLPTLSRKERVILDLLVSHSEMYGLEMVKTSKELKRGTVYVTLARMAEKGFVESRLDESQQGSGPPRRVYSATGLGSRALWASDLVQVVMRESLA